MAGTIPLSLTQQLDIYGKPLSGGQLFLIQAGTVATPQNGFQDTALTIPLPNPITLDAAGRIPQFFLADGSIKVRLVDKNGIVQLAADSILVIGPSAGGGGGTPVDPTMLIQTGNIIARYGIGALAGYVRLNGLSIGSATSGATERANLDCQAAFEYLWNTDPNLLLSPPRGASSSADWTASKRLTLPDWRGRNIAGLADMGNADSGVLPLAFYGAAATVLGNGGGAASQALLAANLPPHPHSGTTGVDTPDHTHTFQPNTFAGNLWPGGAFGGFVNQTNANTGGANSRHTHVFTTDNGPGASAAFAILSPSRLATIYLKL